MKVLDVHGFRAGMDQIQERLEALNEQIEQLQHAIDGIITLEDSLKGKSGEAIRSYYQEIHQTFLLFFQSFLANYDTMIENMKHSLHGLEPDENGLINEVFLDYNLEYGLKKVESVTSSLTDEGNRIMQKVSDIVHLPKLQDDETMNQIKRAKEKVKTTLHQLHSFDKQATRSLDSVRKDIQTMSRFIEQMDSNLKGNKEIITNFTPQKLMREESYRSLLGEFVQKGNMTPIQTIHREAYGNYKSIKYLVYPDGLIVMEYQKIGKDSTVYYEVVTDIPKEVEDGATVGIIEPTIDNILKGIYVGSGKAVGDTIEGWKGLYKLAEKYLGPTSSPDLLRKAGLIGTDLYLDSKAVFGRAVDTGKYMVKAVKDGFVRDVINGDAESRSKYFTYLFTTLGIGVLGDKGISKIGNLGTKVGKFGEITAKVEGLSPSLGTVNAGPIPYNVMNHLEDQVQLVARKAFGDGTKGIDNATVTNKRSNLYRGDSLLHSPTRPNGTGKPHISSSGDLVPASKEGLYKGRQVTVTEHILGGYRKGAKSNSPYTSFTNNKNVIGNYGENAIELDISALRKDIQSGKVKDVVILSPKQIQKLIERDTVSSDFWKNRAINWTKRDNEYLIKGEVPSQYIKVLPKE